MKTFRSDSTTVYKFQHVCLKASVFANLHRVCFRPKSYRKLRKIQICVLFVYQYGDNLLLYQIYLFIYGTDTIVHPYSKLKWKICFEQSACTYVWVCVWMCVEVWLSAVLSSTISIDINTHMHQQTRVSIDPERVENQIGFMGESEGEENMKFPVYLSRAYWSTE